MSTERGTEAGKAPVDLRATRSLGGWWPVRPEVCICPNAVGSAPVPCDGPRLVNTFMRGARQRGLNSPLLTPLALGSQPGMRLSRAGLCLAVAGVGICQLSQARFLVYWCTSLKAPWPPPFHKGSWPQKN